MYRHYKTKEDLFNELVSYAATGLEKIAEKFQSDESPIEFVGMAKYIGKGAATTIMKYIFHSLL
jgi:AcrR family transcriptional regulator